MAEVTITVHGTPAPQGSKFAVVRGGKPLVIDDNKASLVKWRDAVAAAADQQIPAPPGGGTWMPAGWIPAGPVAIEVQFYVPRPTSHHKNGQPGEPLRASAPALPFVRPDLDKYARAVLDSLKGRAWKDDSQVTDLHVLKFYAPRGEKPGAVITVREVWEQEP